MIAKRRGRQKRGALIRRIILGTLGVITLLVLFFVGTVAGVVASYSRHLPDINRMADFQPSSSTIIYARDGTQLAQLYKQNRLWVPISKIPPIVRDAFIATEDRNFYQHHGLDFGGIARAALSDYRGGRFQGASTITQQLARALFLSNEVSFSRKVQEALLALEIERNYTKDEILERYLNIIYFGAGAYGIEAAAHTYFGTDVSRLSIGQAAMLAGLPAAPSDYSPYANLERARSRQAHVLERMQASGFITAEQAREEGEEPLRLIGERPAGLQSYAYPYFTTYAIHELDTMFGSRTVYEGGLRVDTTLDPRIQKIAQETIDWGLDRAKAEGVNATQAAIVAIRPSTGEIVAMVGGRQFSLNNQFNRAWQALRQPGSSFKAFVYTAAIDNGKTPTSIVDDSRVSYAAGADGKQWAPMDDDNTFLGPITLRYALAQSRNVVAVKLAEGLGIQPVIDYARHMGVKAPLEANLSLALGTSVVSPLDMASGYATLANQGVHIEASPIRLVRNSLGSTVFDNRYPEQNEVVSAGTAYVMTTMLESVIREGTGTNANIDRPAAGKTGTTSDYRDAWFVGYTPDLVAAVWIGNDSYTQMNESYGGNIPARIWAKFMRTALEKTPKHDFPFPGSEVTRVAVCGNSARTEFYIAGTQPSGGCAPGPGVIPFKGVAIASEYQDATVAAVKKAAAVAAKATPVPSAAAAAPAGVGPAAAAAALATAAAQTPAPAVKTPAPKPAAPAVPASEPTIAPEPDPTEKVER
jgi:penicillin-binding protein 1A